ncbi:MAG: chorismate mutase [Proteobacteria bacterium]|nr:chorismate mutase [Pseudomonadota bacterium]
MQDKKFGKKPLTRSLTDELVDLDLDLAYMIAKRTQLLSRAAATRKAKGMSLADANQERRMRRSWDEVASRQGLDLRPLRQIFTLANGLAYASAVKPESASRKFIMTPEIRDLDLAMPGPRDRTITRLLVALGVLSGAKLELSPVVVNDPLVELVKVMNQAGASLSWEDGLVRSTGGTASLPGKTLHAGDDPLNLYLLLAMGLPQVGRSTITGGTPLKILDLSVVGHVFAGLGARLTPIEPHLTGAPVRLESGGMTGGTCHVSEDFPPLCGLAMALAGPTYPEGLNFSWDMGWAGAELMSLAVKVLADCGVTATLSGNEFSVRNGAYQVPAKPDRAALPLDAELCATLLALPRFAGGTVTLAGHWPADCLDAPVVANMLRAAGLKLEIAESGITSTAGTWPDKLDMDATRGQFTLAVALGIAAPSDARILVSEDEDTATAEEIAGRIGRFARVKPGRVVIVAGREASNRWAEPMSPFPSPSPQWSLALALASMTAQGVTLANPGSLSETWPGFWGLFAENFKPKDKEPEDEGKKKGRRIRV